MFSTALPVSPHEQRVAVGVQQYLHRQAASLMVSNSSSAAWFREIPSRFARRRRLALSSSSNPLTVIWFKNVTSSDANMSLYAKFYGAPPSWSSLTHACSIR